MRRRNNPDHRFREVKRATAVPENSYEASLFRLRAGTATQQDDDVAYAYEIYSKELERESLQAWIVAEAMNDDITKALGVPAEVIRAYRHLFFDLEAFRDQLDLMSWIAEREEAEDTSERGIALLRTAYDEGLDKIKWLFGRGKVTIDPLRVQEQLMADAYHRSRAHRGAKISSKEAAACNSYAATAQKIAMNLGEKTPGDGNQLMIKLKFNEQTTPVTEVAAREEILH